MSETEIVRNRVTAPVDSWILKLNVRAGEFAAAGIRPACCSLAASSRCTCAADELTASAAIVIAALGSAFGHEAARRIRAAVPGSARMKIPPDLWSLGHFAPRFCKAKACSLDISNPS